MRFQPVAVTVVAADGQGWRSPIAGDGTVAVGPLQVDLVVTDTLVDWSIANTGDQPIALRQVALVAHLPDVQGPLRMFRNGYQSWSVTDVATLGTDTDPSTVDTLDFLRDMHHGDGTRAQPGDLRSEMVTVLQDERRAPLLVGFAGGHHHDGTVRLRTAPDTLELRAEATLGGATLPAATVRPLHSVQIREGDEPAGLLSRWAAEYGREAQARVSAPFQVGWCSWYHYFEQVAESDIAANLAHAADWPFEVFQLDDGYQAQVGDWLHTNDRFPSGVDGVADAISAAGPTPGIWLAPFICSPESDVAGAHPEWFARDASDPTQPMIGMFNEIWGGFMWGLDVTRLDVQEHLAATAADLVDAGYRYLKLDFTVSAKIQGQYDDATLTPAERVRAAYQAVRRGAGDDVFILGCGCPLGSVVGVVDGMRIGPDVAPQWQLDPGIQLPGYDGALPSTRGAWRSTLARSFMHRALWLNDPDCLMLRSSETHLDADQMRAWALAVGQSGGMALVSDDLSLLGADEQKLLAEVIELGREADAEAQAGQPPVCRDLLERTPPTTLDTRARQLAGDPEQGTAVLQPRLGI